MKLSTVFSNQNVHSIKIFPENNCWVVCLLKNLSNEYKIRSSYFENNVFWENDTSIASNLEGGLTNNPWRVVEWVYSPENSYPEKYISTHELFLLYTKLRDDCFTKSDVVNFRKYDTVCRIISYWLWEENDIEKDYVGQTNKETPYTELFA